MKKFSSIFLLVISSSLIFPALSAVNSFIPVAKVALANEKMFAEALLGKSIEDAEKMLNTAVKKNLLSAYLVKFMIKIAIEKELQVMIEMLLQHDAVDQVLDIDCLRSMVEYASEIGGSPQLIALIQSHLEFKKERASRSSRRPMISDMCAKETINVGYNLFFTGNICLLKLVLILMNQSLFPVEKNLLLVE